MTKREARRLVMRAWGDIVVLGEPPDAELDIVGDDEADFRRVCEAQRELGQELHRRGGGWFQDADGESD